MTALPWIRRIIRLGAVAVTTAALAASTTAVALADGQTPGVGASSTSKDSHTAATRDTGPRIETASSKLGMPHPQGSIFGGTWACSVPAGYTYDQMAIRRGVCDPYPAYSYHVVLPADGIWACSVPAGYTSTGMNGNRSGCFSALGNPTYSYHLALPADGIWACSVPAGYTWDRINSDRSGCYTAATGNPTYSYHLVKIGA